MYRLEKKFMLFFMNALLSFWLRDSLRMIHVSIQWKVNGTVKLSQILLKKQKKKGTPQDSYYIVKSNLQ